MSQRAVSFSSERLLDVPLPVVNFQRAAYVLALGVALATQTPALTLLLLALVAAGTLGGARWNVLARAGRFALARRIQANPAVPLEDVRLLRFNGFIVIGLLTAAQAAFWLFDAPLIGWILSSLVLAASALALGGVCVGCVLYYQFKLHRYKFLNEA
jgi:hypothetical protein